jgi:transglutaminase-like putative cysteine protease
VTNEHQRLLRYSVTVDPPAPVSSYADYWGTHVDCFGVVGRHTRLTILADSTVDTRGPVQPSGATPWLTAEASDPHGEYLVPSPHVAWDERIETFARDAVAGTETLEEAAVAINDAVAKHMRYEAGATEIGVTVAEVFGQRAGVCQDYAHLAIAAYRALGVPARYVSGYLYAADAAAGERPTDDVEVSTHAWVEVLIPGYGWWALDPTNRQPVGELHVKIGHGRDYDDVMPLRGVYHGEAESGGLVAVVKMSQGGLQPFAIQPAPPFQRRSADHHQQ